MTDDLRAIDIRCAELMGRCPHEPEAANDRHDWMILYCPKCDSFSDYFHQPKYSSDPAAANLLIEDLRKRDVAFSIDVMEDGVEVTEICGTGAECGDTWMLAVARFYIAVREAEE